MIDKLITMCFTIFIKTAHFSLPCKLNSIKTINVKTDCLVKLRYCHHVIVIAGNLIAMIQPLINCLVSKPLVLEVC